MPSSTGSSGGAKVLHENVLKEILKITNEEAKVEEPKAKEPDFVRETVVIGEGCKEFEDIFGFKAPSGLQHSIRVFVPEDWDPSVREFIPKLDKDYVWPKENTELAVVAIVQGDKLLITGQTGSGKSSLIKNICAVLQIPFIRINFFNQVEYSAVFGMPKMTNGTMSYAHGPIGILGMNGGVMCLDEFSSASSDITMSLQYPLEDGGSIYLPDYPGEASERLIEPHPMFRIVATDNTELQGDTTGKHSGTNVQNTATLDRFQTVIKHNYLDKKHERGIITKAVPTIPKHWVDQMLQMADLVRAGYSAGEINLTMSPRTLINWARKSVYWGNPVTGLKLSFLDKLISDDKKVVDQLVIKVFGTKA